MNIVFFFLQKFLQELNSSQSYHLFGYFLICLTRHNRFLVYICQSYHSIIKALVLAVHRGIYYYYLYYYHLNYQTSVHQVPHIYRPTHAQLSSAKITEI